MYAIEDKIKAKFGLDADITRTANLTLIRVLGIDSYSLAKWIYEEFDNIKVSVKQREGYKFSNLEWVKIEYNDKKEFTLTY